MSCYSQNNPNLSSFSISKFARWSSQEATCKTNIQLLCHMALVCIWRHFGKGLFFMTDWLWFTQHDKSNHRHQIQRIREKTYQFGSPVGSPCSMASYWKNTSWQGMTEACWSLPCQTNFEKKMMYSHGGVRRKENTWRDISNTSTVVEWILLTDRKVASSYSNQRAEAEGWEGRSPPKDTPRVSGRHQPHSPQVPKVPKAVAKRKYNCAFHGSNGSLFTYRHAGIVI